MIARTINVGMFSSLSKNVENETLLSSINKGNRQYLCIFCSHHKEI